MLKHFWNSLRQARGSRKAGSKRVSVDSNAAIDARVETMRQADLSFSAQRFAEALPLYEKLYAENAQDSFVILRLGMAYGASGRLDEAEEFLGRAAQSHPASGDLLNAQANVAWLRAQWPLAEQRFRRALEVDPSNATLWANFGLCLHDAGRLDDAAVALRRAIGIDPHHADARVNAALVCMDLGDVAAAGAHLQRALELAPDFAEAHTLRAQLLLQREDYAEGWREYEWRFRCGSGRSGEEHVLPRWDGVADAARTLRIYAEQGLGDQIMFASCFADVLQRVPHCEVECDPRLVGLFARSFPAMRVHAEATQPDRQWAVVRPDKACQMHCGSLPQLFRRSRADFPRHSGYLKADPEKMADWSGRLSALGTGLKVGIAWRGGVPRTRQAMRSIPLAQWLPLLKNNGVQFVSLQHGACTEELNAIATGNNIRIAHWQQAVDDCDESAALISSLDVVITVCGSVVHLAGALGKPTWVLVPACPEWRYLDSGGEMPWYPAVRLFRQSVAGAWQGPFADIMQRLATAQQRRQD